MGKTVETELKYKLSQKEYRSLRLKLRRFPHHIKHQQNYFFDTPSLYLRTHKIGLRVRIEPKSAFLTLKAPSSKKSSKSLKAVSHRTEIEHKISRSKARALIANPLLLLDTPSIQRSYLISHCSPDKLSKLHSLGRLSTHRMVVKMNSTTTLELDRFEYFGCRDYEIELECKDPVKADLWMRNFFKEYQIKYKPSNQSKLGKFIKLWKTNKKRPATS